MELYGIYICISKLFERIRKRLIIYIKAKAQKADELYIYIKGKDHKRQIMQKRIGGCFCMVADGCRTSQRANNQYNCKILAVDLHVIIYIKADYLWIMELYVINIKAI